MVELETSIGAIEEAAEFASAPQLRALPSFKPGTLRSSTHRMRFPGTSPGSGEIVAASRPRRFIHSRISADDWLQMALVGNPYGPARDPTDEEGPAKEKLTLHAFVWAPTVDYFRATAIQSSTPVVVVCTSPAAFAKTLVQALGGTLVDKLSQPPSKHFKEHRAAIYPAIGRARRENRERSLACCATLANTAVGTPGASSQAARALLFSEQALLNAGGETAAVALNVRR